MCGQVQLPIPSSDTSLRADPAPANRGNHPIFVMGRPAGGALAVARLLSTLLYGVHPNDPMTIGAVAAGLGLVALLASWLPARKASRVDPLVTMRAE